MDTDLLKNLKELRRQPSTAALHAVTCMESFKVLKNDIMAVTGTQSKMTIQYLKDVSNLLALVSAVRENNIEKHLQAERQMVKQVFAFDHQNYARYLSYQHVFLRELQKNGHPAFKDLVNYGYGATFLGRSLQVFTVIWLQNCTIVKQRVPLDLFVQVIVLTSRLQIHGLKLHIFMPNFVLHLERSYV